MRTLIKFLLVSICQCVGAYVNKGPGISAIEPAMTLSTRAQVRGKDEMCMTKGTIGTWRWIALAENCITQWTSCVAQATNKKVTT